MQLTLKSTDTGRSLRLFCLFRRTETQCVLRVANNCHLTARFLLYILKLRSVLFSLFIKVEICGKMSKYFAETESFEDLRKTACSTTESFSPRALD